MRHAGPCALLLAATLVGLPACGGGGGKKPAPSPGPAELFTGTYHYAAWTGDSGPPNSEEARWGLADADGAGNLSLTFAKNVDGVLGSLGPTALTYTVSAARAFEWQVDGLPGVLGGITDDGRVGVLSSIAAGSTPAVWFVTRREGVFSTASLSGSFHMVAFQRNLSGPANDSIWGTIVFDGAGTATTSVKVNEDGGVGPTVTPGATYTVAADGTTTLSIGDLALTGATRVGGDLVVLSGSMTAGTAPILMVLVRGGSSASAATLSGSYVLVGFASIGGYVSVQGTVTADGLGAMTGTASSNHNGTIGSPTAYAPTYTVAADGTLRLTSGGETTEGGVSSDGRFAVVGGAVDSTSTPQMLFLLR